MSSEKLYTPDMLAAAVELANYPRLGGEVRSGSARSPACGSTLEMDLLLAEDGRIGQIGMAVRACAVGQAAAAIFARHAPGRDGHAIAAAHDTMVAWLAGEGDAPDWPDLALITPAKDYPGRHGAMLLPWKAAKAALSSADAAS
ncbi:iron-sulfur cluster assembly scaffold protein [Aurantiacibacter poecillastricola]|uniref:iron-sulfur cluster assembly scaffold protein n=1 Tax=Aurantiacibacter poecillastricola TaxID=3064385 RepID=UPI00273D6864|nr:iron-sulfur cluster assembly scaffold protein [Aurantiacibacter sp. 219JJ12-13]MDP5262011.1 iron-sulfur cluster assembly scaffold protein [Aurantiacibacter sp. 219JJ12-13]